MAKKKTAKSKAKKKPSRSRKKITPAIETRVLARSKYRCCLCHFLDYDSDIKEGQVAHIDHDRTNNNYENLVFLCTFHHPKSESRNHQTKSITPEIVKLARNDLDRHLAIRESGGLVFEIVLSKMYDGFTHEDSVAALGRMRKMAGDIGEIKSYAIREGSVVITAVADASDYLKLRKAMKEGKFDSLGVTQIRLPKAIVGHLDIPPLFFLNLPGLRKKQVRHAVEYPDSVQDLEGGAKIIIKDFYPNRNFATVAFVLPGKCIKHPNGRLSTTGDPSDGFTVSFAFLIPKNHVKDLSVENPMKALTQFAEVFGVPFPSKSKILLNDKLTLWTGDSEASFVSAIGLRRPEQQCFYAKSDMPSRLGVSQVNVYVAIKVDIRYAAALKDSGIEIDLNHWTSPR